MGLNRIYKVVWNKTKGCYVVVSELAKRVGRNKAKAIVMSTAAMAMAVSPVLTSTVGAALNQAGTGSDNAVALGEAANANQARAVAIGKGATISSGQDTIAIGSDTNAKGHTSIVIGKNAKTTNDAEGTVVIGRDAFSEGSGNGGRPNTVVGRGAYTAFGLNGEYRLNAATAFGFQAGAGLRTDSKNSNKLINNETNADNNAEVLVKAGYGLDEKAPADTKAALQGGNVDKNLTFYRKNHINEATALGAEARAIGDQSIAIGGQVVAGDGVVALGGNDTDALRGNKYQVVTDDAVRGTNVNTVDDYNLRYTESTTTVAGQYKNLVGRDMPTAYKSTYGQSGSVVIGMEAHSTTALGTAIGTNSVVRMGAFGATAIGAGSTVQPNAEAAVAIGMGSVANGAYALAGGTASWADYGDIALGYQAKATGKDGAIAMGRATNAQGDSSIMIGGANIASAAAQMTNYQKDNGQVVKKTVTEKINGKDVKREYTFAGTTPSTGSVADAYKVLTGLTMETTALDFARNKNGHASTSLGVHALSKGDLGTAIGAGSRSDAIGSVALGVGAHATRQNAVAIGTGSTTDLVGTRQLSVSYDKEGNIVDDNSPNKAYTFNWAGGTNTAEGDVVSFGSSGAERQLKNVAAGRVADDSTDAINGSQLNSISKKLATGWNIAGDPKTKVAGIGTDDQVNFVNGNGTTVTVTKQEEVKNGNTVTTAKGANVKFDVKAADGSITSDANGISVNTDGDTIGKTADGKLKANTGTINTGDDGKAAPNTGDGNKLATVDTVVNAVNNAAWKATAGNDGSGTETGKSEEKIKAGDLVTFKAGDNLAIKQEGKNFIYSLKPELTGLTSAGFKNAAGDTTVIDGNGMTITPKDAPAKPVSLTKDGLDNGGKTIKNVTSGLTNYDPGTPKAGLVDLSKPATGTPVLDTTAATVGDLRNMGWVVSSDKTTGELTKAYTAQVKNADEVKFVGEGGVTVSGKTENGIRTITVKAEAQEMPEQPVSYTTADGTKVYPVKDANGNVTYHTTPDGKGAEIPKENVIASINGPEGTKAPTTLSNVAGNLDGAKKDTQAPTTNHAPVNTTNAAGPNYVNPNNAATVGDVLNAGWNLQNNGTAKDFVKPYDTVNFVNGANTTAVVTTNEDGTTSNVTYNVTGLPVTYTDKDGKPVSKIGDKYYPVNEKGQPITPDGKPAVKTNAEGKPVAEDGTVIEPVDTTKPLKTALVNPTPAGDKTNTTDPTALNNVTSGLNKYGDTVDGAQVPGSTPANNGLVDLSKPADGSEPKVSDNTAATVGDLRNMGWIVSSDKTTGSLDTPYTDTVKNANEVKFVGEGTATVSGKTEGNVRTITVKVDDQASANNAVSPVVYTDENGDRVYPTGEKDPQGNPIFKKNPDGTGDTVTGPVKTSINGPKGTKTPATLDNVKHNLPTVNDADKKASDVDGNPIDGKNNTAAPITAADAADLLNPTKDGKPNPKFAGNNAATVSDVLNAGWNLQNNGEARDFVKPYDTVNFVNGANTTAVVTTAADGTTSDVTYNVTGLPVTFTDKDGKPVSKIGDKYYPVNEKGQPVTPDGKPAVKTNAEGKPVTEDGTVIEPIDTKANPLQSNLVNPNVENTKEKPNNQTTSPTQLGNVANGANTFDPVEDKKLGNDGKWYNAADVLPNGQPKENVQPVAKPDNVGKAGLIDFSNSNPNNAATVGDLQNLGWIVSAEGNNYSDQVRNANEVKFVGEGTATVTGKTDDKGVRTITVKVDDQVSTNNAVTPVVYTDKDGNKVYPIKGDDGTVTYHTTPDGKGDNDQVVPNNNVVTSINGPEGTTSPTELKNVKNNIPAVNDADKKVTNPDGTEKGTAGDVNNINKAPLTATEAADLLNPTKDGKPNPNFVGNNAATVSDVLNAGWNLQNNGTAKDFVKPYDTVNFVDGANTTAVVTTNEDGTTSNVTYNVTGLPVTFTDKDGKPVSKIGDKYYPVNEKGQPVTPDGKPAVKTNAEGKPVTEDGTVIEPIDTAKDPLKSNMVNPNVANTAGAPNNQTTTPTQLGNVKSNLPTVNDADKKASDVDGNPIDGKNNTAAPITAADAADLLNPTKDGKPNPNFAGNNAATVSDVLNAGWNLQNNGTAKDFVKPYDTVNFVDGANTTAVVTTNEDGTTSNVTYNVTGLPVTFTDKDGKPVSKIGDKYYPVNEKGQPVTPDGKPAVKTNAEGKPVTEDGTVIEPINTDENPLQTNLVNPNVANSKEAPNNQTTSPTQLGNVANGANTFAPVDGKKMANDGKWYPADQVEPNGQPKTGAAPVDVPANIGKAGLIDFSKSNPNNAATVGDLQNLGWIVSAEGNNYSDQVRNANEVKFVGEGTATVTGKTDDKGVRTITVKVDDQVSTNNAQTPVNYTNKDGKKVYPVKDENGNVTYHTTPDGKGAGDETVPAGDVITSLNGPEGTTAPTTLNNVKNNIPAVNDADKKVTNPDGTEKGTAGDVNNINKAPLTATEAADLLKPTKDGKPNPNFAGNNAATVSDVLNAGWNLQNNGEARDFVKPFDTVNFVNGGNTTAVVTTAADGTTSDVTFNVTGLPITYTTADGKPVSKVGDKYYPVNEKGQPIGPNGKPAVKTAPNGDLLDEAGNVIQPIDTAKDPLKSNMVNPNVANTADAPNNQTTTPTQLGNVANGAETFKPADDVKLANDGKWYNAADVKPNGAPKTAEENNGKAPTPVASPLSTKNKAGDVLEKGNDGNWYKSSDLEKGEPKPNAEEQFPEPETKPENADKAGLINFANSNPNNAATVGDLQNMGFVVSAKDNGYTEQMRNANKVEFKGANGVQVTGKTLEDGTREITVALKEGRVTNDVLITDKDGNEIHGVRGEDGKIYTKDPKTGKATKEEIPVKPSDTVANDGNAYVTGNSVATAIQKSGWNIGIGSTDKAFSEEAKTYERVNPKDNVKYVNGANTTVSMVVDAAEDKDGATVTTTYVKVDVNRDLHIDSVTTGGPAKDKAGNPLKQVNGEYYPENALVNDGKVYPAGTVMIDGKPYPAGSAKDPKTKTVLKDGKPAPEAQPLRATPKDQLADGKDGAMTVKDAKGNDGVSATAKDGKGTLTLKDAGKDGKDASQVDISTAKAPADLENTPKDAVRANDGNWYAPADVTVEVKDGKTVVTPKAGKTPIPNAPTMDRIQYTGTDGKPRNVATMDDGLRFVGDDGQTISKPLNSTMEFTGGNRENGKPVAKADTTTGNIGVFHDNGKLSIQLAKDLEKMSSANFENPDGTSTKITGNGLSITPETAKLKDPKTGKPILDKDGNPKVDATKVVSFGAPTAVTDPKTGKPMVDPATGKPVMKSGISAGGQVMANVAPGVLDTDAVNVSQLKGVANNINMRMNRMGAQAAAMGALRHLQYDPLEPTTIMAGVGTYKGEAALALGIAHYKNESTLFHAGASIGSRGDELMANAGVSWKFGSRADETAVKDTFRQGPISSSYTLQDKVSALEAQNQVQKDEINNLKAQLAEVLQYVKKG
ncbi:ESPR-type extended signal peptide-containing protein [Veillonella sp. CNR 79/14]|uniref:ESPR-type extended signal peptide-containing protein n=1 Tax=Veillonella sp. CNR 79/14 TaxID=2490954 RepID=UPI000F8D8D57|nr:ESPR-type extended signal peptide-containing protein [Veillonella sp. CNR 79/14]